MRPRVLIAHASGTNRDHDVAWAIEAAGGDPRIIHINSLRDGDAKILDHQMLVLPGGFSYGDDLGAGKLWAVALRHRFGEELQEFIGLGRPVLGICNGFQALVKAGLLPALGGTSRPVTPFKIASRLPPTSVATTGSPAAIDSRTAFDNPSS